MPRKKDTKKKDNEEPGASSEKTGKKGGYNYFDIMDQWYETSNQMVQAMFNFIPRPGTESETSDETAAKNHAKERIDELKGRIGTIEDLMKTMMAIPEMNKDRMEILYQTWKDFQNTLTKTYGSDKSAKEDWSILTEIWNKWFTYANTMNQQLFRGFYDTEPAESMRQPFTTITGSKIKTGAPFDNISQLDEKSINEINTIFSSYYDEITKEFIAANEAVMFNNESVVDRSKIFFENWVNSYDKFMKELIRTRSFNVLLNDNLKLQLDTKKQFDEAFETHWKLLGLPTRTDVMELHRTIHDLQLKLNRLQKDFKEFNNRTNGKK